MMSKEVNTLNWSSEKKSPSKNNSGVYLHRTSSNSGHHHNNSSYQNRRQPQHRTVDDKERRTDWHSNQIGPIIDDEEEVEVGEEQRRAEERKHSIYNSSWLFSQQFLLYHTPSRKDGVSYQQEAEYRRKGTTFLRDLANCLKLKTICKETAFVYFHRFYMVRSVKQYEPSRMAVACLYLACKFSDHPIFKDHLVRVTFLLRNNNASKLNKDDKEYIEYCDQLLFDENLLLQVLGFHLQVTHSQVIIVEASQVRIPDTERDMYTAAFQIASEINRLTTLCVQYSSALLACVSIYLAACYKCITLSTSDWCRSFFVCANDSQYSCGATETLVKKIGEKYRETLTSSQLIKKILCEEYINRSSGKNSMSATASTYLNSMLDQSVVGFNLNTFSPDSAYSSSSSVQSPHESQQQQINYHHHPPPSHHQTKNTSHMINSQTKQLASISTSCYTNSTNMCNSSYQNNVNSVQHRSSNSETTKRSISQSADSCYSKRMKSDHHHHAKESQVKMSQKRYINYKDPYSSVQQQPAPTTNQLWSESSHVREASRMAFISCTFDSGFHHQQSDSNKGTNHHLNYPMMPH